MLLLQAPEHAAELARAAVEWSGRPVTGLSGPLEQVRQARSELELESADVALDGSEWLYALDPSQLVVPEPLSNGTVVCRPPRPEERDALCAWRLAYDISFWGQPILRAPGDAPRSFSTRRLLKEMRGSPLWKTRLFRCRLSTPHSRILFSSGVSTPRQRSVGVVSPKWLSRHRSSWRVTEAHRARSCSRTTPAQREPTKRSDFAVLETTHSSYCDECQGVPPSNSRLIEQRATSTWETKQLDDRSQGLT